ncbi:hypothetical protein GGR55DRAFT_474669 [Xylaria sp. FL0064]|nr:hypothetical protein GGR55DRAFT_474669 [Xylaria sp. FL0064]
MSKPPSVSSHTTDPKKPTKTITRRRGACKGCKIKKIRCDGGTPCAACDRTGSTCNYEPRPRKASDARGIDLQTPGNLYGSDRPEHNIDRTPRSVESDGLASANELQTSPLVGSPPAMFSLDANMDFLTFSFPNPSEELSMAQAPPLGGDYHVIEGITGAQYPVSQSAISSSIPLETSEPETSRSNATDSVGALSSPWSTLERRMTQVADYTIRPLKGLPEYCRADADIDFRFTTSFSLAELPLPRGDSRKHLEICRILRSLTMSQSPISNPEDGGIQSSVSLSKTTHEATIERCVQACFENNAEISMFLHKASVTRSISEVRESPHPDALSSLFSDAIIAMGLDALQNTIDETRRPSIDVSEQFRSLLDGLVDLKAAPSSLLKLQTAVLLSIMASNINDPRLSEMLSMGVHCARELRFTHSNTIRRTFTHPDDQKLAKRSVWVLYCLETRVSVTQGIPPVRHIVLKLLHSDFIDHLPAQPDYPEKHDALVLQVAAAALLARIFSRVYVQPISAKTTAELQACSSELARWRRCLPDHMKQLVSGQGFEGLRGDIDAGAKLRLFCYYHECVYLLFGPWLPPLLVSMPPSQAASVCDGDVALGVEDGTRSAMDRRLVLNGTLQKCLESAYMIVSHAKEINGSVTADKMLARRLRGLMIISVCVITYGIQYGESDIRKESLAYLGICCGTFGGMYLTDSSLPFEDILDLVRIIRSDG